MADKKISELTALTGANVATDDQLVIVDTSAALTKNITIDEFKNALDTATGFVRITGDTMTGALDVQSTITAEDIILSDADAPSITLTDTTNTLTTLIQSGNSTAIIGTTTNHDLRIQRNSADIVDVLSTGIDVTGTITADGLTVDAQTSYFRSTGATAIQLEDTDGGFTAAKLNTENGGRDVRLSGAQDIILSNDTGTLARFDNGGDISFYEDTGTTAKFFWDASAESLGIGTSSPSNASLDVVSNATASFQARASTAGVNDGDTTVVVSRGVNSTGGKWSNAVYRGYSHAWSYGSGAGSNEAMRIDSSGNVGIGASSPVTSYKNALQVHGADGGGNIRITNDTTGTGTGNGFEAVVVGVDAYLIQREAAPLIFYTSSTEAMRIDSSGNVGIGVVPETWNSANNGLQVGPRAAIFGTDSGYSGFSNNQYQATDGSAKYIVTAPASIINLDPDSTIKFRQAASGTADTAITWSEAMRIDSSGRLLLGTQTFSAASNGILGHNDGRLYATATSQAPLNLNLLSSDGDIALFSKDGAPVGSIGTDGTLNIGGNSTGIKFGSAAVWATTGGSTNSNGAKDLGASTVRWKDLYLSGGVYLGGTGAANKLDDFEEGQFDVTISPATSGTISISTSYDKMRYTKVGNIVHVQGEIRVAAVSSPVGADVRINNLPFTSLNGTDFAGRVGGATYYYQASSTSIQVKAFRVVEQDNKIRFAVDASTVTANDEFAFNFTYTVA